MTTAVRCPECGSASLSTAEGGRRRCPACGSSFVSSTAWVPLLLTCVVVGAVVGILITLLSAPLGLGGDRAAVGLISGAVTGALAALLARRFRKLRKV